jgi:hypothetical protein
VLSLFILVLHGEKISTLETSSLFVFTAFAAATHSATLGVLLGLCCCGFMARPLLGKRIALTGLLQGSLTVVAGAAMLVSANFALSGQCAWTPGGYGRRLRPHAAGRHCRAISQGSLPTEKLKLCPYRNELPPTADDFPWGDSMFNTLGRFQGLKRRNGPHRRAFARRLSALAGGGRARRDCASTRRCRDRRRHHRPASSHLRHHRALHPLADQADARRTSTALVPQFRRGQLAAHSGRAALDAAGRFDGRPLRSIAAGSTTCRCWR